jgi:hypothetical protein
MWINLKRFMLEAILLASLSLLIQGCGSSDGPSTIFNPQSSKPIAGTVSDLTTNLPLPGATIARTQLLTAFRHRHKYWEDPLPALRTAATPCTFPPLTRGPSWSRPLLLPPNSLTDLQNLYLFHIPAQRSGPSYPLPWLPETRSSR